MFRAGSAFIAYPGFPHSPCCGLAISLWMVTWISTHSTVSFMSDVISCSCVEKSAGEPGVFCSPGHWDAVPPRWCLLEALGGIALAPTLQVLETEISPGPVSSGYQGWDKALMVDNLLCY